MGTINKVWDHASDRPLQFLVLWALAIAGVRLAFVVTYTLINGGFNGVDEGAYLLGLQALTGENPYAGDIHFTRAPLAPGWLLWPAVQAFGIVWGSNLYSWASSLPAIGAFYILARSLFPTRWALAASMLFSLDWLQAELLVTGTAPLMGTAFVMVVMAGMVRVHSRLGKVMVVMGLPIIAYTNQTSLALAAVTLPVFWLALQDKRTLAVWCGLGALLTLTALPWYWEVLPGTGRVSYPGAFIYLSPSWSAHWHFAAAGVGLGVLALWRGDNSPQLRGISVALVIHSVLQVFLSHDEAFMNLFFRSTAWMMPLWWLTAVSLAKTRGVEVVGWVQHQLGAPDRPSWAPWRVAFVALLGFGLFGVAMQYKAQAYYSELAGGPVLDAIGQIDLSTAGRIGTNAESRAFYIAAVTQHPVVWTQSALPAAAYWDEELALKCEIGWVKGCDRTGYISHFLIDEHNRQMDGARALYRSPDPQDPWDFSDMPWMREVYRQGSVVLYELEPVQRSS